jgi:hypothetical protein
MLLGRRCNVLRNEPKDKYGQARCYIRDPDGYIIEVEQSEADFAYG